MKPIFAAGLAILSVLATPRASTAALPVEATLSLPHDHVLPGVPFDLVVTFTNVSNKPVSLVGAMATLVVTFPGGERTVMHKPEANDQWSLGDYQSPKHLRPGESVRMAASLERGGAPNWFRYGAFSGPGTYGIALDLRISDDDGHVLGYVRTPVVTLTRVEPAGIDAALWKRMQEISDGKWSDDSFFATKPGVALADEIIQLHPTSGYYPYLLAIRTLRRPEKTHIPALREAAERFRDSPAYPYLLSAAAISEWSAGMRAMREGKKGEAQKYFAAAESTYRAALATKNSIVIRASAERGLQSATRGLDHVTKKPAR